MSLRVRLPHALAGLGLMAAIGAQAQSNWREVAVPVYGLEAVAQGEALALAERALRFDSAGRQLAATLAGFCAGTSTDPAPARAGWAATATAWDALAALSTGPLIERRSARSIDFTPARPLLLARAVAAAPQTLADLERIGAPARGLPALELLLWPAAAESAAAPLAPRTPACSYASLLALDIAREAGALRASADARADARAAGRVDNDLALAALVETVNQWVAGVEQLRWTWLRKPLDVAATRTEAGAATVPEPPRHASGQTAASWAARWQTLRDTAVLGSRPVPVPGQAAVPFETLLRGRGLNPLADRLVAATGHADAAMQGLRPTAPQRVRAAAQALGELATLAQDALAPALGVPMGFSDADGD